MVLKSWRSNTGNLCSLISIELSLPSWKLLLSSVVLANSSNLFSFQWGSLYLCRQSIFDFNVGTCFRTLAVISEASCPRKPSCWAWEWGGVMSLLYKPPYRCRFSINVSYRFSLVVYIFTFKYACTIHTYNIDTCIHPCIRTCITYIHSYIHVCV